MPQSHQMPKSYHNSHNASRNGLVFAVRGGRGAPAFFKTWNECKEATKGFSNPMFRKLPRALAERCLLLERDEDAHGFAKLHPTATYARATPRAAAPHLRQHRAARPQLGGGTTKTTSMAAPTARVGR
jgi:hypothetical protein